MGEDEALITDGETPPAAAPRVKATGTRPDRKTEKEGPPPDRPHDPATPLERTLADILAGHGVELRAPIQQEPVLVVPASQWPEVARTLKADPRLAIDYPRCLSGVDLVDRLEAVYHLYSVPLGHQIWVKIRVTPDSPTIPSVTGVWRGFEWHEREAAEMFGFHFPGHPFMKLPFLLDEGFEGHPLLKSFELEPEQSNVHPN